MTNDPAPGVALMTNDWRQINPPSFVIVERLKTGFHIAELLCSPIGGMLYNVS